MDPVVRPADLVDADALHDLQASARAALIGVRGGALRLEECPVVHDWPAQVRDPATVVLVGTLDDAVLGYLVLRLANERNRGIVTHVFVEEGARELGLGDLMIEHATAAVRAAGLAGIEGTALPGDRETKNLFERAGITARKITVYKSLLSGADA
jgi:GNAT superfamily N-acetyltransferase